MAVLLPQGKQQYFTNTGEPLAAGKVYTYDSGTTTPRVTYTDEAQSNQNTNPIILDARGEATIYWSGNYRVELRDSLDNVIWTRDGVSDLGYGAGVRADLASTSDAAKGAGMVGYLTTTAYGPSTVGAFLNRIYQRTAAEIVAGVTPTYDYYPEGNARRYGAVGDGVTNDTAALQRWLDVAEQCGFGYLPTGTFMATSLSLVLTGNRITQSVTIYGNGRALSNITKISGANGLLVISPADPNAGLAVLPIVLHDIGFLGASKLSGSIGVALRSCAQFQFQRVLVDGFDIGINNNSSLIGSYVDCEVTGNNTGYLFDFNSSVGVYNNLITIERGRCNNNTDWGIDIGYADVVTVRAVDMEQNGTSADTSTGAAIVRDTCDNELGITQIYFKEPWLEGNLGRGIVIESGMSESFFEISGGHIIGQEGGRSLLIQSGRRVSIDGLISPSVGDTWDITCDQLFLKNTLVNVLTDTNVTYPTYINAAANSTTYVNGRTYSWTGTLTGVSGTVTGTITSVKQGNVVRHIVPDLIGTSTTTAATITGMPANVRPDSGKNMSAIVEDNGVDNSNFVNVASSGVVTLFWNGGAFTASGSKGIRAGEWPSYTAA